MIKVVHMEKTYIPQKGFSLNFLPSLITIMNTFTNKTKILSLHE